MNTPSLSAITGSGQADTLQGAVQVSLLKKSMDLQQLLPSASANPALGKHMDVIA